MLDYYRRRWADIGQTLGQIRHIDMTQWLWVLLLQTNLTPQLIVNVKSSPLSPTMH